MSEVVRDSGGTPFWPDQPISLLDEDRLGRRGFAEHLAGQLLSHNDPSPLVIALYAPWGTGKSSLLNLVQNAMEQQYTQTEGPVIVRFNPWNFSSVDQLITMFFREIFAGMGMVVKGKTVMKIGAALETLAMILKPVALMPTGGSYAGWGISALGKTGSILKRKGEEVKPLEKVREEVDSLMDEYGRRVFIFIDDIDRLEPENMLLVFKLIRLVADFRNTTYVLAVDRQHVEKVLTERHKIDGRKYIEKIVQVAFDIPPAEPATLAQFFSTELDKVVSPVPEEEWNSERWQELYLAALRHFFRTSRDIVRYVNGARLNLRPLLGEVDAVDFLGLEAIRTFCPDVYEYIRENRDIFASELSSTARSYTISSENTVRDSLDALFDNREDILARASKETCKQLFPQLATYYESMGFSPGFSATWRKQKRICSRDYFDRYFYLRVPIHDISDIGMRSMLFDPHDTEAFRIRLEQLTNEDKIGHFLERLEDFAVGLPNDRMQMLLTALFDLGDRLPPQSERMLGVRPRLHVAIVTSRLLRQLDDTTARATIAKEIARSTTGLSTLVLWVSAMEPDEGNGQVPSPSSREILPRGTIDELRSAVLDRIRDEANQSTLSRRSDLSNILFRWRDWAGDAEPKTYVANLVTTDEGLIDLLVGFLSEIRSSGDRSYVERKTPVINRELIARFVEPEPLIDRALSIRAEKMDELSPLQKLAVETFVNPQGDPDFIAVTPDQPI